MSLPDDTVERISIRLRSMENVLGMFGDIRKGFENQSLNFRLDAQKQNPNEAVIWGQMLQYLDHQSTMFMNVYDIMKALAINQAVLFKEIESLKKK